MNTCNCWSDTNEKIKSHDVELSHKLSVTLVADDLEMKMVLPLERIGGKRMGSSHPRNIIMKFCPMCGTKFDNGKVKTKD